MKKTLLATAALGLIAIGSSAYAHCGVCGSENDHGSKAIDAEHAADKHYKADIVETAIGNEDFSTLVAALQAADLVDALKGEGPFTVFAPTNEAFNNLPEGTVEDLLKPENKEKLAAILTYHVVPSKIMAGDIQAGETEVKTLQGQMIKIDANEDGVMVNDAIVTATDIGTSNGVIHVIDTVILPSENSAEEDTAE